MSREIFTTFDSRGIPQCTCGHLISSEFLKKAQKWFDLGTECLAHCTQCNKKFKVGAEEAKKWALLFDVPCVCDSRTLFNFGCKC